MAAEKDKVQEGQDQNQDGQDPNADVKKQKNAGSPKKESLALKFETSGWCEELKLSYRKGVYHCKSKKEYEALKKFASEK